MIEYHGEYFKLKVGATRLSYVTGWNLHTAISYSHYEMNKWSWHGSWKKDKEDQRFKETNPITWKVNNTLNKVFFAWWTD